MRQYEKVDLDQPEIKKIGDQLYQTYGEKLTIFKHGPDQDKIKSNLVGVLQFSGSDLNYIKAFTTDEVKRWKSELEIINTFNDFADKNGTFHRWPEIIAVEEQLPEQPFHFIMKDVTANGVKKVDFPSSDIETLLPNFQQFRKEIEEFGKYSNYMTAVGPKQKLQYSLNYANKVEGNKKVLKYFNTLAFYNGVQKRLQTVYKLFKILKWHKKGKQKVDDTIDGSTLSAMKIASKFHALANTISAFDYEYSTGRYFGWHVFDNGRLLDFDNVWPQVAGTDAIYVMRSNTLLAVHEYESYDKRRNDAQRRYDVLLDTTWNEQQANILLFQKLIGTIYSDYAHAMILPHKIKDFEQKHPGIDAVENAHKGIKRNYALLKELYFSNTTS